MSELKLRPPDFADFSLADLQFFSAVFVLMRSVQINPVKVRIGEFLQLVPGNTSIYDHLTAFNFRAEATLNLVELVLTEPFRTPRVDEVKSFGAAEPQNFLGVIAFTDTYLGYDAI